MDWNHIPICKNLGISHFVKLTIKGGVKPDYSFIQSWVNTNKLDETCYIIQTNAPKNSQNSIKLG